MKEIKIIHLSNSSELDLYKVGLAAYHLIVKALSKGDTVRIVVVDGRIIAHVTDPANPFAGYDQADFDQLGMID